MYGFGDGYLFLLNHGKNRHVLLRSFSLEVGLIVSEKVHWKKERMVGAWEWSCLHGGFWLVRWMWIKQELQAGKMHEIRIRNGQK